MWTEKYRPKILEEVYGCVEAKRILEDFVKNFSKQKKKALLLWGRSGVGKTALIHAFAKHENCEIVELNASDFRDKERIESSLKHAGGQQSLFNMGKIILIDDIEALSGKDKGGMHAILALIEESHFPVILTANDLWNKKLNELRSKVMAVEIKNTDYRMFSEILINVC